MESGAVENKQTVCKDVNKKREKAMHCEAGLFGAPLALEHAPQMHRRSSTLPASWQPPDFEWWCMGYGALHPWGVCGVGWEGRGARPGRARRRETRLRAHRHDSIDSIDGGEVKSEV